MKQPKYKIGDKFTKEEVVKYKGTSHKLKVTGFITGINQTCGTSYDDITYEYQLSSTCTYFGEGREVVDKTSENTIDKVWNYET